MFSDPAGPSARWYPHIALAAGCFRFFNLGFLDLQAWDEALYAVRARAVLEFGAVLDQTPFAIDGLYSSLHPPLHVWLTAAVFYLFGTDELTARLVSASAGAATLPLIVLIGRRIANSGVGLLAALLYGLNPFVTFYARQGQFDSLLVFLLTASAFFLLKSLDEGSMKSAIAGGLFLGGALMSKLFVALGLPLAAFVLSARRSSAVPHFQKLFLRFSLAAALTAIPWHLFMAFTHAGGNIFFFLTQSSMVQRALFGIEGNVKPLEVLYYVNQMIVLFPIGAVWFAYGFRRFWRSSDVAHGLLALWFVVFFAVFSLMRTKLAVYLLPMLIPASLIAASALWEETQGQVRKNRWFVLLSATVATMIWSSSQPWRDAVKGVLAAIVAFAGPDPSELFSAGLLAISCLAAIGAMYFLTRRESFSAIRSHCVIVLLAVLGGAGLYDVLVADKTRFLDGGSGLGVFVGETGVRRIVVAGVERNPQLSYYLEGADIGWREDLSVRRIIPPADTLAYRSWLAGELAGEAGSVLLVIEKDKFVRYRSIDPKHFVPADMRLVLESRRYAAYVRAPSAYLADGTREGEGMLRETARPVLFAPR